jgi:putative toxin-antitoxin system antitoxin component (TIGR02293 family)
MLFKKAVLVFSDKNDAREWFKRENRSLNNKTPLEYSDTEIGAREVEDLLGRIEHGVFG